MTAEGGRSSYHHGDLKEALLCAADELLTEKGVAGLTLRACARRAGVSHAAPKHHFADASELMAEVAARSFDRLTASLRQTRRESDVPEKKVIGVFLTYVKFARTYPNHFRLMFRWDAMSSANEALRVSASQTFAEMTSSVTVQRGESAVTPETLGTRVRDRALQNDIILAWSQMHGYTQLLLEGQFDRFAQEEGLDAFVDRTVAECASRLSDSIRRAQLT